MPTGTRKLIFPSNPGGLETPDEVMNIASAMLFAGFKGVVATLWSIDDADGPVVSEAFYKQLFRWTPEMLPLHCIFLQRNFGIATRRIALGPFCSS